MKLLARAAACMLIGANSVWGQVAPPVGLPFLDPEFPPAPLHQELEEEEYLIPSLDPAIGLWVTYSTKDKQVHLHYTHSTDPQASFPDVFQDRTIPTRYWPTRVTGIDGNTLLVAGKKGTGETLIEIWRFRAPTVVTNSSGNPSILPGSLASVERVYNADQQGKDMVLGMMPLLGSGGTKALVQFYDSRDLYELDLVTHALVRVATPGTASGSVLQHPGLAQYSWRGFRAGEHDQDGYVYILRLGERRGEDPDEKNMAALYDSDKDGQLDSIIMIGTTDWETLGYNSGWTYHYHTAV